MKRAHTVGRVAYGTGNILRDVAKRQLRNIGAVSIAYNEAEATLDLFLQFALRLWPGVAGEVTSRINGADGKIAIAKKAIADLSRSSGFGVSQHIPDLVTKSLEHDGFALLKQYRDAVIHAHKFDVPTAIARTSTKRGKPYEVLMSATALKGLYDRLVLVRNELWEACTLAAVLSQIDMWLIIAHNVGAINSAVGKKMFLRRKAQTERDIRVATSRYRRHQNHRLSLPPLPKFPSEYQLRQAHLQWVQGHQDWLAFDPQLSARRLHPAQIGLPLTAQRRRKGYWPAPPPGEPRPGL